LHSILDDIEERAARLEAAEMRALEAEKRLAELESVGKR
jgi:hypothetical protein